MLHDTSNTNSDDDSSIKTAPQNLGNQDPLSSSAEDLQRAREMYVVAYLRSLSDELRSAVEVVTDHLNGKLVDPETLATRPVDVWKEATRVVLYTKDIYASVYDRTPDGFMPIEGHDAAQYLAVTNSSAAKAPDAPASSIDDDNSDAQDTKPIATDQLSRGGQLVDMVHQAYIGAYLRGLDPDLRDKVKALIGTVDAGGSVSKALEIIGLEPVQVLAYLIDVNAGTYDRTNHPIDGHKSTRYMLR